MNNSTFDKYMEKLPIEKFGQIIPNRREIIEKASAQLPKYEYNANIIASQLHPLVQHVIVTEITERPGGKTYKLEPDKEKGTEMLAYFKAGQYISVDLTIGQAVLTRAYTLSSCPADALKGFYTITIKRSAGGFASNFICDNWKVGTRVDVSAPDGDMNYEPLRDAPYIVGLAGGTGITPFMSLAGAIADGTEKCTLTLLYGSRTEKDIMFRKELEALAGSCDKIKVVHVLSDEQKDGFESGFISAELIKKYAPQGDYSIFMCGPQAMYRFLDKEVEKLGLPRRRVRHDAYGEYHNADHDDGFPKDAVGKTFNLTVELPQGVKKIIPAKSGESILVALERAGIKAPSKCRSGECGFCRSRLKSGTFYVPPVMEYRRKADVAYGYIHPCCSFPTSDCYIFINCDKGDVERKTKDMAKKQRIISIIMSAIMSTVMGVTISSIARSNMTAEALASAPAAPMIISSALESIIIGQLVTLLLPVVKWGRVLAARNKAVPPSLKFTLLNCLPISLSNCTIISIVVSFINVSQAHARIPAAAAPPLMLMWVSSWIKLFPISVVVSYLLAIIISPVIVRIVGMPVGGPPAGAPKGKAM